MNHEKRPEGFDDIHALKLDMGKFYNGLMQWESRGKTKSGWWLVCGVGQDRGWRLLQVPWKF